MEGVCVFLSTEVGRKGGGGGGWPEISGGTNQLLRVGRTPSLDAGQRSSPFSLRPQHYVWRLPWDRETATCLEMDVLGSPARCQEIPIK